MFLHWKLIWVYTSYAQVQLFATVFDSKILMAILKKIFSINNLILVFALFTLVVGIYQFFEIMEGFDKLILHKGIIQKKGISLKYFTSKSSITKNEVKDSVEVFNFSILGDSTDYTASKYAIGLNNLLQVNDSIEFYTQPINSKFGNFVTNGRGRVWNTNSPNEVYHLVNKNYGSPLLDFHERKEELKNTIWLWPFFSLGLFGWFFYRQSGKKSIFIIETRR